jgi:hypothetical protein
VKPLILSISFLDHLGDVLGASWVILWKSFHCKGLIFEIWPSREWVSHIIPSGDMAPGELKA